MKLKRQLKLQMQRYHEELYLQSLHNCFMQQQQHHPQHHPRIPPPPPSSHHSRLYSQPPPPHHSREPLSPQHQQQPMRNCFHGSDVIRSMPYLKPSVSPPHSHATVTATPAHHLNKITSDCNQALCRCRHHSVDIN